MLLASIPLIHNGQGPIGGMSREVWVEAMTILLDQKILPRPVALDEAYPTRFLDQISSR